MPAIAMKFRSEASLAFTSDVKILAATPLLIHIKAPWAELPHIFPSR
jgi:hypothetical protein